MPTSTASLLGTLGGWLVDANAKPEAHLWLGRVDTSEVVIFGHGHGASAALLAAAGERSGTVCFGVWGLRV